MKSITKRFDVEAALETLAAARDVKTVKRIRDQSTAVAAVLRVQKAGDDLIFQTCVVTREADARLGELLGEVEMHGGDRRSDDFKVTYGHLESLGLPGPAGRKLSERCQRIARVPEDARREYYDAQRSVGAVPTMAGLLRLEANMRAGETMDAHESDSIPSGRHRCIVIDPPWPSGAKQNRRTNRPNQAGVVYPTMSHEEIAALPVCDLGDTAAHLYLWTTHRELPFALELVGHWGFGYHCLLTWRKNVGFTPYSFMFSTEHVVFARRGGLDLTKKGMRVDFDGKVRQHSRKPEAFYDLVRAASPGPRLEMFARESRDGFEAWGAESNKFTATVGESRSSHQQPDGHAVA